MSAPSIERSFCTTSEAAALLGVSVATVQAWVENGLLEAWKTSGGHRRIVRDSVERLLRRPSAAAAEPLPDDPRGPSAGRPTVMVVEDDLSLLRLYDARLSRWPQAPQVLCINNAVLALLRIGRRSPDLLIMDLDMPGMDGFSMLHHLRHSPEIRHTTIAVVTGLDREAIQRRGGLPGDVEVFGKPVDFDALQSLWVQITGRLGVATGESSW